MKILFSGKDYFPMVKKKLLTDKESKIHCIELSYIMYDNILHDKHNITMCNMWWFSCI